MNLLNPSTESLSLDTDFEITSLPFFSIDSFQIYRALFPPPSNHCLVMNLFIFLSDTPEDRLRFDSCTVISIPELKIEI